jgi:hypothetical protein
MDVHRFHPTHRSISLCTIHDSMSKTILATAYGKKNPAGTWSAPHVRTLTLLGDKTTIKYITHCAFTKSPFSFPFLPFSFFYGSEDSELENCPLMNFLEVRENLICLKELHSTSTQGQTCMACMPQERDELKCLQNHASTLTVCNY